MLNEFWLKTFQAKGFNTIQRVLSSTDTSVLRELVKDALLEEERMFKCRDNFRDGILSFPPIYSFEFIDKIVQPHILEPVDKIIGDNQIYLFMSSTMFPGSGNYSSYIHRDFKAAFPIDKPQLMGALILLDDFNANNGATVFYKGSHKKQSLPSDTDAHELMTYPKGSIVFFDGLTAHKGGVNLSDNTRSCLALGFCKTYIKPRFDFKKILERNDIQYPLSDYQRAKLGYMNRRPVTLHDYWNYSKV